MPWPSALPTLSCPGYRNERLVNPETLEEGGQRTQGSVTQPSQTPGPIT